MDRTRELSLKVIEGDKAEDLEPIRRGLFAANDLAAGRKAGYLPLVLHLLNERGDVMGGAFGHGSFDWFFLEMVHVDHEHRGQGYGSQLLDGVERFAEAHDLVGIWLDTFSFQAKPFYEKHGYKEFGRISGHPIGGERYFMLKRLDHNE